MESKKISSNDDNAKAALAKIPKVTDPEFGLACYEVAQTLSKNWRFKLHVFGFMLVAALAVGALISGAYGWTAKSQIEKAKVKLNKFIQQEFQKDNIKRTIQQVADNKAAKLIQDYIEPSIANSKKNIDEFNQYLNDQKMIVSKDISVLQQEIKKLQERNNITNMADKAVGEGDLHAFEKLKKMTLTQGNEAVAAEAELMKIYAAYSPFAPKRWEDVRLNSRTINLYKFDDEELSVSELLVFLNDKMPKARARAANLLVKKSELDSYSTAKAIIEAIKKEDNLIVMHNLISVFTHVTGYSPDQPDGSDVLEWWREHESSFAKKEKNALKTLGETNQ